MLRHTPCIRSALKHFRSGPFQISTRLLHNSNDSPSTYDHASIDHRLNKLQSEMRDMNVATDHKIEVLNNKLEVLGDKLSTEIKVLGTSINARFEISDAKTQSKFDALRIELKDRESRFWVRVVFTLVAVASLTSSAALLRFQNRAIQTSTVQTPAIQTPTVQAPAVGQNKTSKKETVIV